MNSAIRLIITRVFCGFSKCLGPAACAMTMPSTHRAALTVLFALLVPLLLVGCDKPQPAKPALPNPAAPSTPAPNPAATPSQASTRDTAGWPEVIRVGLVPTEGGADTKLRFIPLSDALEKHLGRKVELLSPSNYQGVVTAMGNDQLEFAYYGPKSYIQAARRAKAEALLVELNKEGERGYRCLFITPAASPITSIKDAKGKKFAYTDVNSTSGYLIPAMTIVDMLGVSAEDYFSQVTFSGSHTNSMLQVGAGEIDLAATNDLDMNKAVEKGGVKRESFRIVHTTELIPGSAMACRKDLPDSLKKAFIEALMSLNSDKKSLEMLQNGGYQPVTDREYDVIRASQAYMEKMDADKKAAQQSTPTPTPAPTHTPAPTTSPDK